MNATGSTRRTLLILPIALAVILTASGPVCAATLNVYTAWPETLSLPLFKAYTAATGVEINFIRLSSGEILARAVAERANPRADVIFGAPADTFAAAKVEGILEPYRPAAWEKIPAGYKDAEGYYHGFSAGTLAFMSNPQFLRERSLKPPTSWLDLLDPAYRSQIQTADARTSGTALTRILSIYYAFGRDEERAFDYQKKLHPQIQVYTKSGGGGTIPVALGQAGVALVHLADAMETRKKGYDVVVTFPREGVALVVEPVGLLKGAKNRDLATRFIDWVMSPDLQNLFARHGVYVIPTHPEAAVHPEVAAMLRDARLVEIDLDWAGKHRRRLVNRWIEEVLKN